MNRFVLVLLALTSVTCALAGKKSGWGRPSYSGGASSGHSSSSSGGGSSGSGWSEEVHLPSAQLFPYGLDNGDGQLPAGDDSYISVPLLLSPIRFLGQSYNEIYINNNGILSFGANVSNLYQSTCTPGSTPLIAVLWSDVDTRFVEGSVYFRETDDRAQLLLIAEEVRQQFKTKSVHYVDFEPASAFIVTWSDVSYWGACTVPLSDSPRNIYQAVLATDGRYSYVYLIYKQIMWTGGMNDEWEGCDTGTATLAQAGFDQGDGHTWYQLPFSCTEKLPKLVGKTNVDILGKFMYRVDRSVKEACEKGAAGSSGPHGQDYDEAAFENVLRGGSSC